MINALICCGVNGFVLTWLEGFHLFIIFTFSDVPFLSSVILCRLRKSVDSIHIALGRVIKAVLVF